MSISLLYHGFGLRDQEYLKTEYKSGCIIFHIRTKFNSLKCSCCGSKDVVKRGVVEREFHGQPIGLKPVIFHGYLQRLFCDSCGLIRQESVSYADEKKASPNHLPGIALDCCDL
jgi:hypothetical protein